VPSPLGLLLVGLAGILWGTTGSVSTVLAERAGTSPLLVGAARVSIAALVLVAASLAARASSVPRESQAHVLGMGSCMAAYQICFFVAVSLSGITVTALIAICSAPLIIGLLAQILLGERLSARTVGALVLGVTGTALLVAGESLLGGAAPSSSAGALLALAAGVAYALYAILAKLSLARCAPLTATAATFTIAAIVLVPTFLLVPAPGRQIALAWPWLLYLGGVATAGAYAAYTVGLREIPASVAGVLTLLEPLTASLLGVGLFGERLGIAGWSGAVLILAALILLVVRPRSC
jgi:drug/metabolite transporter, DME family